MSSVSQSDRRCEPRLRALKGAHIVFNKGYSSYDCLVRDLTQHGARLKFGDRADLPEQFDIAIGESGELRPARICWRKPDEIGIRFT